MAVAEVDATVAEADAMAAEADAMAAEADAMAAEADAMAAEAAPEPADATETGIADAIEIGIGIVSPRVAATAVAAARKTTDGQTARQ